ncbi:hypothetical protein [Nitrospira sp. CMX1]
MYCTSTPQILLTPRAGLTTRLSNFATNCLNNVGLPLNPTHDIFVQPEGQKGFDGWKHDLRLFSKLGVRRQDV